MTVSHIPVSLIPIKVDSNNLSKVVISKKLLKRFKIKANNGLILQIGRKMIPLIVEKLDSSIDELHLSKRIFKDFSLPVQTFHFIARYTPENNTLWIGPIIGLLTDFSKETETPNFRSVQSFSEELHHGFSHFGGFLYVFAFSDFNDSGVNGYYFENGKWIAAELPFPHVIYNRIHSRIVEQSKNFKMFRKKVEQLNIPLFNDRFLSKWEVSEQLMQQEEIVPYIPETQILSKENLYYFIEKYEMVFIKPIHGSQGRNIIKLVKEDDNFHVYHTSQNLISEKKQSKDEIFKHLKPLLHNRIYIIQQGISLASHESRAIDFRVLCHKNKQNLWEVTSLVARISAEEQFVSNIARGGKILKPSQALGYFFKSKQVKQIVTKMKKVSIDAASIVSRNTSGITGELGIDIGVDQDGQIWIIEINSKPSKNYDDIPEKIRPSAKAIIQFCHLLAFDLEIEKEE